MKKKIITVNVELKRNTDFNRLLLRTFKCVLKKTRKFRRLILLTSLVPVVLITLLFTMFVNKYKYNNLKVIGVVKVDKPITQIQKDVHPITTPSVQLTEDKPKTVSIKREEVQVASRGEEIRELDYKASLSDKELLCHCVESEAGNQPYDGKVAVANVILNRVENPRFPNTIRGVIYAPGQFQVVSNGAINRVTPSDSTRAAVDDALSGVHVVPTNVTYFATPNNNFSRWATPYTTIGGHKFWIGK